MSRPDETKTMNPILNKAFVASSGDIITDYNDLYCIFMPRVASRCVNITMSAFVIRETTSTTLNTCSKLVFDSSGAKSLNKKTYLQAESQKLSVLAKLGLPHFIETVFVQASIVGYSSRIRL